MNPDRHRQRDYYWRHRDEVLARMREDRLGPKREHILARDRKNREAHREQKRAAARRYAEKNAESIRERAKKWYEKNKARIAERSRILQLERRDAFPARNLLKRARRRARRDGREFAITEADILAVWPPDDLCPILGIRIGRGLGRDAAPTLDRIDNRLGYVPGNLAVMSWRANTMKGALTVDNIRALARLVDLAAVGHPVTR